MNVGANYFVVNYNPYNLINYIEKVHENLNASSFKNYNLR